MWHQEELTCSARLRLVQMGVTYRGVLTSSLCRLFWPLAMQIWDYPLMSLFVLDYDHNAANVTELEKTHEKMFLKVRDNHPNIPIIIMNRPKYYLNEEEEARRDIIVQPYQNAINAGDKNVYFIDGRELMKLAGNEGTVDNCHPNDLGFESMAQAMITLLKMIL